MSRPSSASSSASALSLHDARPFFEKALAYGVQHGLIDGARRAALCTDAPKGMVQIARYFGSEFLRPDLEKARERMVNLISLFLEDHCEGDLRRAAESLRDHSLLSRSKGGSDLLKQLIALPQNTHFALHERGGFTDAQKPLLAQWTLKSLADYRAELVQRRRMAQTVDAALWLAAQYDLDAEELETAGTDAEAVIRTALLWQALAPDQGEWPHTVAFEQRLKAWRKNAAAKNTAQAGTPAASPKAASPVLAAPPGLPAALRPAVEALLPSVQAELPRLLDSRQPLAPLLRATALFRMRFFLIDDPLAEVEQFHHLGLDDDEAPQPASKTWQKLTQGHEDEHSLLTLWLCLAAGSPRKTLLTEKTAASVVRRLRKHGADPAKAREFITAHAPGAFQADYLAIWDHFWQDAQNTLLSDRDYQLHDALALLRRECHVAG
ncbi:MAG: hypothetical protein PHI55_09290 [Burkholderiaceae bacterium]|nr:hypothetical protein [Burkholderiaceae bacterium]